MCLDPGTLGMMALSTGLSAAGGAIQQNEMRQNAQARANARNSVLAQSLERQRKYEQEARGLFDQRMKDYEKPAQDQTLVQSQADRTGDITKNITAPTADAIPLSGSAPEVVKGEVAKRMLKAFEDSTARAKAMGKVGGYGDNWLGNNMGVADTARRVGTVNNFSRNDAALLPAEQDLAEAGVGGGSSMWGQILGAGGNILAAGAGRGWSPFGAGSPNLSAPLSGGLPLGMGGIGSR